MSESSHGAVSKAKAAKQDASARWEAAQAEHPSLGHAVEAWKRFGANNGGQYAAAITYFSFLALFPLILLAVSIAGYVLNSHPAALQSLFDHITNQLPGSVGSTVKQSIQSAIDNRAGVGIIGLLGVLLTGLGWIGNLRAAIDAVWGVTAPKLSFVKAKLLNLLILVGLGLAMLISLGLTAAGTSLTGQIVHALSAEQVSGMHAALRVVGILVALVGDMIIFWWLLVRLPKSTPSRSVALKGALAASIGFEALKVIGTYTVSNTSHSPTAGPFAGIIAVLIWLQLVARLTLLAAAWMAVLTDPGSAGDPTASAR